MMNAASARRPEAVIVVVEDEFLIRMCAVDLLTAEGFTTLEAGHAEDAIGILQCQANEIHLVFTDVHMPGPINGVELAHHVRSTWPHVALLVTSSASPTSLPEGSRFLAKPYPPEQVLTHVREMIKAWVKNLDIV